MAGITVRASTLMENRSASSTLLPTPTSWGGLRSTCRSRLVRLIVETDRVLSSLPVRVPERHVRWRKNAAERRSRGG